MSLKSKFSMVLSAAVAVFAFSAFAAAQDTATPATPKTDAPKHEKGEGWGGKRHGMRGEGKGMRHGGGMMRGLRGITLTDAQKEQLKAIHEANKPDEATMTELRTLREAKKAGTLTAEQTERMRALRDQSQAKFESVHQQVLAILTPEQRQQLETRKEEMKKRMEERRQLRQQAKPATEKPTNN
jgi:Spy/CpxP family protein refolding chaperone